MPIATIDLSAPTIRELMDFQMAVVVGRGEEDVKRFFELREEYKTFNGIYEWLLGSQELIRRSKRRNVKRTFREGDYDLRMLPPTTWKGLTMSFEQRRFPVRLLIGEEDMEGFLYAPEGINRMYTEKLGLSSEGKK